ncbi:MAG TPA: DUF4010 domain-containing protein [Candidatus Norongarragalinales archaeon]|jgi:uncharacterized membrane protein (DUF4010 family)|nr:DUF4010 domain-containing protein [Candidatus Norongarragalinales archaeon]
MSEIDFLLKLVLSVAIGGLIGLEREKAIAKPILGLRTFALLSFLGMLSTFFTNDFTIAAIGLVGCFAFALLFYYYKMTHLKGIEKALGLTTALMVPFAFFLGMLVGTGRFFEAGAAAIVASILLVQRERVHKIIRKLSTQEISDLIIFAVIAFVVYPLLPAQPLNVGGIPIALQQFWLVVILASLISFSAHILVKFFGPKAVIPSLFLAGVVSALATLALLLRDEKHAKKDGLAQLGLFAASAGAILGDFILLIVINAPLFALAFLPLLGLMIVYLVETYNLSKKTRLEKIEITRDPISMKFVIEFAAVFFAVSLLVTTAAKYGGLSLAVSSALSGLVSASSVVASVALLSLQGGIDAQNAIAAIIIAQVGAMMSKIALYSAKMKGKNVTGIVLVTGAAFALSLAAFAAIFFLKLA